jgi:radical SAM protein with 4Fe4S-binding SPASM domain
VDYFITKPELLRTSLTNVCNYRCVMCYNPDLRHPRGFMEEGLLRRIVDQCVEAGIGQLSLGATGEPLLHPRYLEFLRLAKQQGLWVSSTTNATRLDAPMAESMIALGLNRLNLSIYSTNPQEHMLYTRTDNFAQVVENIRGFLRLWSESDRSMHVNMWFLPLPGINSYENHLSFWKPLADQVGLEIGHQLPINWSGRVAVGGGRRFALRRDMGGWSLFLGGRQPCPDIRSYLHILHTGDVLPCCNAPEPDVAGKMVFGNIDKDQVLDIWRSEKYISFKKAHARKAIVDYPDCRRCSQTWHHRQLRLFPERHFTK